MRARIAAMSDYLVFGRRMGAQDPCFAECLADAHARRHRPLCLCTPSGHEMYVTRLDGDFFLKRMPFTGSLHAPDCPSYDPPAEISGVSTVLGSAIREDPDSGLTLLKLDFAISKAGTRSIDPAKALDTDSVATDGARLTLRGLLQYLWDEAELTRWQPEFAGKRTWATVRKHLLQASTGKIVRGRRLIDLLYVPEVFAAERRGEINARRLRQWMQAELSESRGLMIAIAEVKELCPARFGFRAVLKHVPDQAFLLDQQLYRRMEKRFERELSLWGTADAMHMLVIATFAARARGVPEVQALSLLPVTSQWLPVEDAVELQLLDRLVREGRRFKKTLHYGCCASGSLAAAVLLDTEVPCALYIKASNPDGQDAQHDRPVPPAEDLGQWTWDVNQSPPRPLPAPQRHVEPHPRGEALAR
jgi:hypothetical protein